MKNRNPLGYINLEGGKKPIYATNDFFLNYTFDKVERTRPLKFGQPTTRHLA